MYAVVYGLEYVFGACQRRLHSIAYNAQRGIDDETTSMDSRYSTPLPPPGGQATAFISANDQIKAATASLEYPQLSDKTCVVCSDFYDTSANIIDKKN